MAGFTKLFSDIVRSTIWREPDHVRIVWITMLAIADKHGVVESSFPGLADLAKVGLEQCGAALEVLKSPDEWSRTKVDEGRRIREVDGGWLIINYEKYRNRLSADDRREYQRVKQVEYRSKKKQTRVKHSSGPLPGETSHAVVEATGDQKAADALQTAALPDSCQTAKEEVGLKGEAKEEFLKKFHSAVPEPANPKFPEV